MGKPTGFLDYERKNAKAEAPLERIKHFNEFHTPLSREEQEKQGARCMACGVPFCQAGQMLGGMMSGCPLQNLVPEWNDLVYLGNWEEAYYRLSSTSNFPEFTGRVCPGLCEAACTCNLNGDPVGTKSNELAIIENAYKMGYAHARPPKVRSGKKVAVIGSGPSGLATADQLNRRGHSVTVYERRDRVGGLLMYGIPNMKLEKHIVERKINIMKEEGVTNILLIGNDSRENGEDGRSDAMILLSISNKTKKIYMTSLLRDMYVDIPGHKGNRLNAAYSYGGAELLMETIEQNFDIHISRYVLVNFEAFANLVDAVGGVDLELTSKEVEYVNGYLVEYNILLGRPEGTDYFEDTSGGMVHLNGPQALAYCRNRYIGTDFGRTERQRKVLAEVIHKLPQGMLTNPQELIDGLMPNLTTNLTQTECYRLSLMAPKAVTYDIIQNSIPLEGTYKDATIRKMAVLEVDFEANKKFLQENLYGDGDITSTSEASAE